MRTAYKLLKVRRNGTLGPLFINARQVIEVGAWMRAEAHRTKGFAFRPGWHCTEKPTAPHLKMGGRVWCEVEIDGEEEIRRPVQQGGLWFLAQRMRVTRVRPDLQHEYRGGTLRRAARERSLVEVT